MKKILAFLLIALLISGCESNSGNKSIDEGDVFVVGMECNVIIHRLTGRQIHKVIPQLN